MSKLTTSNLLDASSTNRERFNIPLTTVVDEACPPNRTDSRSRDSKNDSISPDIPASMPSIPRCNRQAVLIASSLKKTAPSSSTCSVVGSSQTRPIQGDTIEDRNASIVEIGASSTKDNSIATSPWFRRRES